MSRALCFEFCFARRGDDLRSRAFIAVLCIPAKWIIIVPHRTALTLSLSFSESRFEEQKVRTCKNDLKINYFVKIFDETTKSRKI